MIRTWEIAEGKEWMRTLIMRLWNVPVVEIENKEFLKHQMKIEKFRAHLLSHLSFPKISFLWIPSVNKIRRLFAHLLIIATVMHFSRRRNITWIYRKQVNLMKEDKNDQVVTRWRFFFETFWVKILMRCQKREMREPELFEEETRSTREPTSQGCAALRVARSSVRQDIFSQHRSLAFLMILSSQPSEVIPHLCASYNHSIPATNSQLHMHHNAAQRFQPS